MVKRMLIDANHPEEKRVVVLDGTRLDEFDLETATKAQLKGNIYLAKVVRVEPSLQAAFVDYGGNRHGFLAFSEIHPDYYQIPVADREALLAEEKAAAKSDEDDDEPAAETASAENDQASADDEKPDADGEIKVETVGGEDEEETSSEAPARRRANLRHRYKIQEVIKKRQILLVQVVKEERGNKGAALTTYLSLAGRYCVLMPNSARGGGVSRKITSGSDRKRLKSIISDLKVPDNMAVILRTAGSQRSKAEVKRDYEYLQRLWNEIRETTMESRAPALIYEEANLIKRSIRDVYTRDIEEILVEGEEGYKLAKGFMKTLTPSHAKKVQPYKDDGMPLFHRYQVEQQLDAMLNPEISLKSGGSIVFAQTEALVAIDVNSGKATKERHIEETALKTNLEAADEIARQLRLRDLAGLVVIDFIDMEENRNNHAVERRLKEALKGDRARIQVGRISHFGLLELSRQRLRPSLVETSFTQCPHCQGTGLIRSIESTAMFTLRMIEEEGIRKRSSEIRVTANPEVALYLLNYKRSALRSIEERYEVEVLVLGDPSLIAPDYRIDRTKSGGDGRPDSDGEDDQKERGRGRNRDRDRDERSADRGEEDEERQPRKRKRRRRRRGRRGDVDETVASEEQAEATAENQSDEGSEAATSEAAASEAVETDDAEAKDEKPKRRRRRSRRKKDETAEEQPSNDGEPLEPELSTQDEPSAPETVSETSPEPDSAEATSRPADTEPEVPEAPAEAPVEDPEPPAVPPVSDEPPANPKRGWWRR